MMTVKAVKMVAFAEGITKRKLKKYKTKSIMGHKTDLSWHIFNILYLKSKKYH